MRSAAVLAVAVFVTAVAGCGDDDTESVVSEGTDVTITLDPDGPGGEPAQEAKVECPGANSPQAVCSAIDELPNGAAAPVPPETPCTEIYGGPDAVTIEGTLNTEPIDARLTRESGCEIERFERFGTVLAALFPDYEPGASAAP